MMGPLLTRIVDKSSREHENAVHWMKFVMQQDLNLHMVTFTSGLEGVVITVMLLLLKPQYETLVILESHFQFVTSQHCRFSESSHADALGRSDQPPTQETYKLLYGS